MRTESEDNDLINHQDRWPEVTPILEPCFGLLTEIWLCKISSESTGRICGDGAQTLDFDSMWFRSFSWIWVSLRVLWLFSVIWLLRKGTIEYKRMTNHSIKVSTLLQQSVPITSEMMATSLTYTLVAVAVTQEKQVFQTAETIIC